MKLNLNRRQVLTWSAVSASTLAAAGAGLYFFNPDSLLSTQAAANLPSPFPFDPLSASQLRASSKKAFAYYFPPFPISIDNKAPVDDYYAFWLDPEGKNGEYRSIGGYMRNRPIGRAKRPESTWIQSDFKLDVQRAIAIGLDGFVFETMDHASVDARWGRTLTMLDTAKAVDPDFRILLGLDPPTSSSSTPDGMINVLLTVKDHPSLYRLADGRIVISPFYPERNSLDWWKLFLTQAQAKGIKVALVPLFLGTNMASFTSWMSTTYGVSSWGTRKASSTGSYTSNAQIAHNNKNIWMSPIAPQDMRPKDSNYWEASNSQLFRNSWEAAIQGNADWATMITWNDYSEATEVSPSSDTQYAFYDLAAYYVHWFKMGNAPQIKRDTLYYFYRTQPAALQPDTSKQTKVMQIRAGSDPASDKIEVVALLTQPGTLEITIGGKTFTQPVGAGLSSFTAPLAAGTPTFRLLRNGTPAITLPGIFPITNSITYQDLLYHAGGSGRPSLATRRSFQLVNRNSDLAFTNPGSGGVGTVITQATVGASTTQQWALLPGPDDYYQLQCKANGLVVDVQNSSTSQSALLVLATASPTSVSQLWRLASTSDGSVVILNKLSGYAMDVRGATKNQGANLIQYAYHEGANQQWQIKII